MSKPGAGNTAEPQPVKSLVDFMQDRRRAECPVCHLAEDIRDQLRRATDRKVKRADQLEWLITVVGATVTNADLDAHYSGRH